jgi:hypothetical protein
MLLQQFFHDEDHLLPGLTGAQYINFRETLPQGTALVQGGKTQIQHI